eukprot:12536270-Ditylum_brightwellii.AAC.1
MYGGGGGGGGDNGAFTQKLQARIMEASEQCERLSIPFFTFSYDDADGMEANEEEDGGELWNVE